MSVHDPALPRRPTIAYALVPGEDELVFVASDEQVLTRVLILHLVAQLKPTTITPELAARIRRALLDHQWEDALVAWMDATGRRLNIFADEPVWTDDALDEQRLALELPLAPIFEEPACDAQ